MSADDDALDARSPLDVQLAAAAAAARKPALVVLVMGETARADRFSFNGYERDTNRYTRARDVVNFPRVVSCGTSTAESVPCIFSGLGQAQFSHRAAMARESIVGAMQRLGVEHVLARQQHGLQGRLRRAALRATRRLDARPTCAMPRAASTSCCSRTSTPCSRIVRATI